MYTYVKCGAVLLLLMSMLLASCNEAPQSDSAATDTPVVSQSPPADATSSDPAMDPPPAMDGSADTMQVAAIGQKAPDFTLTDTAGQSHSLAEHLAAGNTVVLEWFNPGCSVVHHYYQESTAMPDAFKEAQAAAGGKLVWLAVNSQNPEQRGGSPAENQQAVTDWAIPYPVLLDPTGTTGKSYGMSATPCIAVISPDGVMQYKGSLDEYAKGGGEPPIGTNFVLQAVREIGEGKPVSVSETQALG